MVVLHFPIFHAEYRTGLVTNSKLLLGGMIEKNPPRLGEFSRQIHDYLQIANRKK